MAQVSEDQEGNYVGKLVTQTEFAKYVGVTRPAITQAVTAGRISDAVVEVNGKKFLDLETALYLYNKNTRRTTAATNKVPPPQAPKTRKEVKDRVDFMPDDEIPDLNVSRARAEHYKAEISKLQLMESRKDVVPAALVKKEGFEVGRVIREALMNLADRLSNQIAGESDPRMIHKMITDEHRIALEELSRLEK